MLPATFAKAFPRIGCPRRIMILWVVLILSGSSILAQALVPTPHHRYPDQAVEQLEQRLQSSPSLRDLTQAATIISDQAASAEAIRDLISSFEKCLKNESFQVIAWSALSKFPCPEFHEILIDQLETDKNWVHPELFQAISRTGSRDEFYRLAEIATAPPVTMPSGFSDRQPVWDTMFTIDAVQATGIALQAYGSYLQAHPGTPTAGERPFPIEVSPPTYAQEVRPIPLVLLEAKLDALLKNDDTTALLAPAITEFLFSGATPSIPLVVGYRNGERRQLLDRIEKDLLARNTPVAEALLLFYCDVDDTALAASAEQANYSALIRYPWILNHINWTRFLFTEPQRDSSASQGLPQWLPKARTKLLALQLRSPVGTERFALPSVLPIAQSAPTAGNDPFPTVSVSSPGPLVREENADYKSLVMSFGHYFGGPGWAPSSDYYWNAVSTPLSEDELEDLTFRNAAEIPMTPPSPGVIMFDPSFMNQSAEFVLNQELTRRALLAYAILIRRTNDGRQAQPFTMATLDAAVQNILPSVHSCVTQVVDKLPEARVLDASTLTLPSPGPYRVVVQERYLSFAQNAYLERVKIIGSSGAAVSAEWVGSIPNYLNLTLRSTPRYLDLIGFSLFANDIAAQIHPRTTEASNLFLVASDGPFALRLLLIQARYPTLSWPIIKTILETDVAAQKSAAFSPQLSLSAQATKIRSNVDILPPPVDPTNADTTQDDRSYSGYRTKLFQKWFEYFSARETLKVANALVGPVNSLPNTVGASPPVFGLNFTTGWFGGGHQNGQKVVLAGQVRELQNQAKAIFSKYPGPTPNTSELSDWEFTPKRGVPYVLAASTCSVSSDGQKALLYVAIAHFGQGTYETVAEVDTKLTDDVRQKLLRSLRIDPYWLTRDHITFLDATATEPEDFASLVTRIGDRNSRVALLQDNADRSGMTPVLLQNWYLGHNSLSSSFPASAPESSILRSYITTLQSAMEYVDGNDPPAGSNLTESFLAKLSDNFAQNATYYDKEADDKARPVIDAINSAKSPPSNGAWEVGISLNAPVPSLGIDLQINGLGINLSFTDLDSNLTYSLIAKWNGIPLPLVVSGALGEPPNIVNDLGSPDGAAAALDYMSPQGDTVDVSSIASNGRRAATGSLLESSSLTRPSESNVGSQSSIGMSPPRLTQSVIANPITGYVLAPRNIGQFSYDGSTWFISLKSDDAGFEVWARTTQDGYSARDKRLFTISIGEMSEIANFTCSAKDQLERDKTLVGCAVSGGAFAFCAAGPRMCKVSLDLALDGPLAACIEGLKDVIAKMIVRDPVFSELQTAGAIQDKDWLSAISATMDLLCQHYKDTPNGRVLESSAVSYGELLWMWGQYYQQYPLLTSQQRKQVEDALTAGAIPSDVRDLLLKNSTSSSDDQGLQWQTEIVPELVPANVIQQNPGNKLDEYISKFNSRTQEAFDSDCSAVESRPFVEAFANAGIPVTRLYIGNNSSVLGFEDDYFLRDGRMIRRMLLARTPDAILPLMRAYPAEHVFERVQIASLLSAMSGHEVLPEITSSESTENQFIASTHGAEIKAAAAKLGTAYADSLISALKEYINAVTARQEKLSEPTNGVIQPIVLSELQRVVYDVIPTPYKELSVTWNRLDDEMKSERAQSWVNELESDSGAVWQ